MASPSTPNGIYSNPAVASATDEDLWGGILNSDWNIADAGYTTRTHDLNFADYTLSRPKLKDYGEVKTSPTITAGVLTLDFTNGNHFTVTLDQNVTSIVFSNFPAGTVVAAFVLVFKQNGTGGYSVTFPSSVKGTAPTITTTANSSDVLVGMSFDNGTSIVISPMQQAITGLGV